METRFYSLQTIFFLTLQRLIAQRLSKLLQSVTGHISDLFNIEIPAMIISHVKPPRDHQMLTNYTRRRSNLEPVLSQYVLYAGCFLLSHLYIE